MDSGLDNDWKKTVGFPINYDSSQSSEDEFDTEDVVMRHARQSSGYLLADGGDGSEADVLGSTPPRSRIRNKEKRRTELGMLGIQGIQKPLREKKDTVDHPYTADMNSPGADHRLKKRASLKLIRSKERDWKQDMIQREPKADSLPSPNPLAAVPTLVESCSRFMSLSSRPKCRESAQPEGPREVELEVERRREVGSSVPASRVNFHQTFSMLINMGNVDKGCRRTISREEQVWQNELKDLIWLELQAKLAGRSLTHQDAYLCAQRNIVPTLIKNIFDYRFVNRNPCQGQSKPLSVIQGSCEDVAAEQQDAKPDSEVDGHDDDSDKLFGCLSFECERCSEDVGRAMREVGTLLDSFYNAVELYPSTKAMTQDHPLIATQLFKNRIKAMCLWFNTAMNMRLKIVSVRQMLRSMRYKSQLRRRHPHRTSLDSDISRQSSESHRPCQVRFNVSNNPTDSSNSDSSSHSEHKYKEDGSRDGSAKVRDDDEVDSGVESFKYNGQTTPEIVISDSNHGTGEQFESDNDAFDLGPLDEIAHLRLLDRCSVSLYREYHREILKTQGVRRCMMFIYKMRKNLLQKVYLTLEKPDVVKPETFDENDPAEVFEDSKENYEKTESVLDEDELKTEELRRYGWWSAECRAMRLPSYRSHFLLLTSICMEAVHDYLAFRLETRPDHPSCLTVKQLIHELKEGLDISTEMRCEFMRNVEAALGGRGARSGQGAGAGADADHLRLLLDTYDTTVEAVLKQYLSYLRTMSVTEHMSRASLQREWAFTARLARRVKCAALLAPLTFSDIACNQLNRLIKLYRDKFEQLTKFEDGDRADPDKYAIYAICRSAQSIYACERESTLQAAQWARALAARLARAPHPAYLQQREEIFNSLMAIRDFIVQQSEYILEKSRQPISDEVPRDVTEGVVTRVRELLLQAFKLGFELHKELYKFAQAPFKLLEEKVAKRQRPASLQPTRAPALEYRRRRPETMIINESFNPLIHKELHRFANASSNRMNPSLGPRRSVHSPLKGRPKFTRSESIGEDCETSVFDDKLFENLNNFGDGQVQSSIELLLSGSQATPAPPAEPVGAGGAAGAVGADGADGADGAQSCVERAWAWRSARAVVQFARCWMHFVVERCDRGRGLRPRWASQGLEFLMLACDPCNTKHLTEEEFEELKQLMDGCISHVVGSRPAAPRAADVPPQAVSPRPRPRHRMHSPLTSSSALDVPTPPTPPSEPEPLLCFSGIESTGHKRRVVEAIEAVDSQRDERLRRAKSVGRVVGAATTAYEPKLRQLTFKWQRGLKIGAGTFGKVYTVVNTSSGQLLAMKELQIGAGDRRALQRAANELQVLEGVAHPHLVRYYGCEVHREEMLLFMELCVEGSLEALVGTSGALAEGSARRYTRQLLSAVAELHARAIVHRDIKSGNIFLTNEGNCLKLGDFGCAVKIRANTTAPGELQGFVGTQAYMAPEVFMKSSGHGRAADIWSVGCVVTEMASGKRPFSEYDSNYQIMFVVGMGGRPHIPASLSEEGRQFCVSCLTHDPDLRPRAEELTLHHFLMVNSEDDCQCQPSFLIP